MRYGAATVQRPTVGCISLHSSGRWRLPNCSRPTLACSLPKTAIVVHGPAVETMSSVCSESTIDQQRCELVPQGEIQASAVHFISSPRSLHVVAVRTRYLTARLDRPTGNH